MSEQHETKVIAAGGAAPYGLALAAYVNWQLGVSVFGASKDAGKAVDAVAAVPAPLAVILGLLITGAVTYAASWLAPHTPRAVSDDATSDDGFVVNELLMAVLLVLGILALVVFLMGHVNLH